MSERNFRIAFSYHPSTRLFSGETKAWEDEKAPGEFLLPANATFVDPQVHTDTETCFWKDGAWHLVSRTAKLFWKKATGEQVSVIDHILFHPGQDFTDTVRSDPESVWNDQAQAWEVPATVSNRREASAVVPSLIMKAALGQALTEPEKDILRAALASVA